MSPLATTFSVSVPLTRSTVPKPASCNADRVTVSLPVLPVKASTFVIVPTVKSTVVPLVRTMVSLLAPPSIDSPETKSPLARLIVSLPAPAAIVSAPVAACDGIGDGAAGDREGFGLTRQRDRDASPGRRRGDRLHPLDRCVRAAQRVELGRRRRQIDRVASAGTEIDGARAGQDCIELSAGEGDRVRACGAGEVSGIDVAQRGKRKLRDVPVGHDVQRVRAADEVDGPEAGQLQCRQSDGVAAGAARQGLDVRHRAEAEVHRRAIGKDDGVAVGTAIDRLARDEVAVGQIDRVVAGPRRDRVGTRRRL